jgi:hypothetical protein
LTKIVILSQNPPDAFRTQERRAKVEDSREKPNWEPIDDETLQVWSRHYDSMQWTAITVYTAGVFLLLAYAYSSNQIILIFGYPFSDSSSTVIQPTISPWLLAAGLWITNLTILVVSSFRRFRNNQHRKITKNHLRRFLMRAKSSIDGEKTEGIIYHQWLAFSATFAALDCAWLYLFRQQGFGYWVPAIGIVPAIITGFSIWRGWPEKYNDLPEPQTPPGVSSQTEVPAG